MIIKCKVWKTITINVAKLELFLLQFALDIIYLRPYFAAVAVRVASSIGAAPDAAPMPTHTHKHTTRRARFACCRARHYKLQNNYERPTPGFESGLLNVDKSTMIYAFQSSDSMSVCVWVFVCVFDYSLFRTFINDGRCVCVSMRSSQNEWHSTIYRHLHYLPESHKINYTTLINGKLI